MVRGPAGCGETETELWHWLSQGEPTRGPGWHHREANFAKSASRGTLSANYHAARLPDKHDGPAPFGSEETLALGFSPRVVREGAKAPPRSGPRPSALVLLRHKFIRAVEARQHGHRGKRLTRASMMRRRTVAIEFGTWRSGRNGGSSGSVTVGYGKVREPRGGTRS